MVTKKDNSESRGIPKRKSGAADKPDPADFSPFAKPVTPPVEQDEDGQDEAVKPGKPNILRAVWHGKAGGAGKSEITEHDIQLKKQRGNVFLAFLCLFLMLAVLVVYDVITRPRTGVARMFNPDEWAMVLINKSNALPKNFAPPKGLARLEHKHTFFYADIKVDSRIYGAVTEMLTDAAEDGFDIRVSSGYRNIALQESNYVSAVYDLISQGYTQEQAEEIAGRDIAEPGASEHNAGLALDMVSGDWWAGNEDLNANFADTPEYWWLYHHAYNYGFILRYPLGKSQITGFTFEPWHWRYVGKQAAKDMYESGEVLEEYLSNS
ncbi:hypothetical protein FACS1894133_6010 [Clostridia bacterium]|nr:hypothetical protein FACS1894133_6010 [Clostridia bacterium]